VILVNLGLLREDLPPEQSDLVDESIQAAEGSARLTRRLLAFSRKQPLQPRSFDLNTLVEGLLIMLRRTLSASIEVDFEADVRPLTVLADRAVLESALLNLALNARDAMPKGGRLTFRTGERDGRAFVSVEDTGAGMDPTELERAVEPYFTTKPEGQGTGLGLSMVFGFAQQSGGDLKLESTPGEGTVATLFLPLGDQRFQEAPARAEPGVARRGATVLVVEDEPRLLRVARRVLEGAGLRVLEAVDGPSALEILGGKETVDLLFTDVVLPGGLNGVDLAERARELRPDLRILFTSGYTSHVLADEDLLHKPYRPRELVARVLDALADASADEPTAPDSSGEPA
jgi:CheY-like chemotaxis protein